MTLEGDACGKASAISRSYRDARTSIVSAPFSSHVAVEVRCRSSPGAVKWQQLCTGASVSCKQAKH
ncbi:hypothetical protein FOMPIDRAFT_1025314 [Fomitopsis schrenkii]|uniref:Uncharacterized protein n=1 Tax=Fomitopsis schrenkii TaxID=2126942 RepID=S8F4H0_FOMSC|nr:hypothetical protein FOMPIDRAFT_1025314 [Fomitopsis schrenkii]